MVRKRAKKFIDSKVLRGSSLLGIDLHYFARNGLYVTLSEVVQIVMSLLLASLFARMASMTVFGEFQLIVSLMATVAVVAISGFDTVVIRDAAHGLDGVYRRVLVRRFWWSLLGVPIFLGIGLWYWVEGNVPMTFSLWFLAGVSPIQYVARTWSSLLRGKSEFKLLAKYLIIQSIVGGLGVLFVVWVSGGDLLLVVMAFLTLHILLGSFFTWRSRVLLKGDEVSSDWLTYSYFLTKSSLVKRLVSQIDKILVGVLFSPSALAIYAVAIVLPARVLQLLKSVLQITMPKLASRDQLRFKELGVTFLIGVTIFGCAMFLIRPFILLFFGGAYQDAIKLSRIAAVSLLFFPVTSLVENFALVSKRQKTILLITTLTPIIKIVLLLSFTATWGVVGFAVLFAVVPLVQLVIALSSLTIDWKMKTIY